MSKANRSSLNVEGAYQHVLTDLYGFIATAVSGAVVMTTGFARADSIASLIVVVLMVRSGVSLVRASGQIFLQAAPDGVDPDDVGTTMVGHDAVVEVHDLHIWEITSDEVVLSAHVLVETGGDCHAVRKEIQARLREEYDIKHATLEIDHAPELLVGAEVVQHCEEPHGKVLRKETHA
jgi:cobalt-zinc-cadmium efflux system protein